MFRKIPSTARIITIRYTRGGGEKEERREIYSPISKARIPGSAIYDPVRGILRLPPFNHSRQIGREGGRQSAVYEIVITRFVSWFYSRLYLIGNLYSFRMLKFQVSSVKITKLRFILREMMGYLLLFKGSIGIFFFDRFDFGSIKKCKIKRCIRNFIF